MGCFWSSCGDEHDRCHHCGRRPVNDLVVINNVCQICDYRSRSRASATTRPLKALYGEFKCSCGRFWSSRYSRPGIYQNCERCRKSVYPHNVRELKPSDYDDGKENREEHKQELCQMCQQLGYHCGRYGNPQRSRSNSRVRQKRY